MRITELIKQIMQDVPSEPDLKVKVVKVVHIEFDMHSEGDHESLVSRIRSKEKV